MTTRELVRHRGLLAVLVRDVVSITGSQMTWVAIPWFVLTTTGSPARMTLVLAVEAAALGIVGFLSGNVVSRLGPFDLDQPRWRAETRRVPEATYRANPVAIAAVLPKKVRREMPIL